VDLVRLGLCLIASVPAGWLAQALVDRVPSRAPLWRPLPGYSVDGGGIAIQGLTSALFALAAFRFEDAPVLVLVTYLAFFLAVVALAVIDLRLFRLPDAIVGGSLVLALPLMTLASLVADDAAQVQPALIGGAFYFGFLLLAHLVFPRGMGFGDVKLAALLGLHVGWLAPDGLTSVALVLYAMIAGFLVGSAAGIVLFAVHGRSRHYPFGPFLIGGALVVIFFSAALLPEGL
jgi:leader peptidase (prepilin peptidase)/N-methyltransferase